MKAAVPVAHHVQTIAPLLYKGHFVLGLQQSITPEFFQYYLTPDPGFVVSSSVLVVQE
jgi:hypothetical protein